jgi:hypothetical protein
MNEEMKAFRIDNGYEEGSIILFAKHRATAQRNGAQEMELEFGEVTCQRKKEYDIHYPKVPIYVLLADGWWWMCDCGNHVTSDDVIEIDEEKEMVYCENCVGTDE